MSRRLKAARARTALSAGVVIPLAVAHAASCTAWTDPKGDSTTNHSGQSVLADANIDITTAAFGAVGDSLVVTVSYAGASGMYAAAKASARA